MTRGHAKRLRTVIEMQAVNLPDNTALDTVELFPVWKRDGTYAVGDRVRYKDVLYRCLTAHMAQETWTPTDAPSLWAKVLIPDASVISEWEQPDSTNSYMTGDKVTHGGKTWTSTINNNVWEPGAYGWEEG